MTPVLPGSTLCDHSPAVVQPQEGCTAVNTSTASPVLVKINSCLTGSPALSDGPPRYSGRMNWNGSAETAVAPVPTINVQSSSES